MDIKQNMRFQRAGDDGNPAVSSLQMDHGGQGERRFRPVPATYACVKGRECVRIPMSGLPCMVYVYAGGN